MPDWIPVVLTVAGAAALVLQRLTRIEVQVEGLVRIESDLRDQGHRLTRLEARVEACEGEA